MNPELPFPYAAITHPGRLEIGQRVSLDARTAESLRFRHVNPKEAFTLRDAEGIYYRCSLVAASTSGGEALVYERMPRTPESPLSLTLYCAVLARQRMIFVAQKATELGIVRLVPLFTERSVQPEGMAHEKAHAWPGQAVRAAKQCRRAVVPEVLRATALTGALAHRPWLDGEVRYYLDDRATASAPVERGPATACLAAGPEGGWSNAERKALDDAGARPLLLGGRVLRAETAVLAGIILLQHKMGDVGL